MRLIIFYNFTVCGQNNWALATVHGLIGLSINAVRKGEAPTPPPVDRPIHVTLSHVKPSDSERVDTLAQPSQNLAIMSNDICVARKK